MPRSCCFIYPHPTDTRFGAGMACPLPAEWELWPSTAVYEFVDACTDHVGELLDDSPETRIVPIKQSR